jgi:hypothetical protein
LVDTYLVQTNIKIHAGSVESRTISVHLRDSNIEYKVSGLKFSSFRIVIATASHMFA